MPSRNKTKKKKKTIPSSTTTGSLSSLFNNNNNKKTSTTFNKKSSNYNNNNLDDEKLQELIITTLKYGLIIFIILLICIVLIKKSNIQFASPRSIMENYVMTWKGMIIFLTLIFVYISRTIYFTKMKEYLLKKMEERRIQQQKDKAYARKQELESRKLRSNEIDLKDSQVATNVSAAKMRIKEKNHTIYKTIHIDEVDVNNNNTTNNNNNLNSFYSKTAWREDKKLYSKSKPNNNNNNNVDNELIMIDTDDCFKDNILDSEMYLSQNKQRVEIDLNNNLTSSNLIKKNDITIEIKINIMWKINLLRVDKLKVHIGCKRCVKSYVMNVSGQWLNESQCRKRCTKCSSILDLNIKPMLCHKNSTMLLCKLNVNKGYIKDVLDGTTMIATCDGCGCETVMPPLRRKVRVEKTCISCNTKLALSIHDFIIDDPQAMLEQEKMKKTLNKNKKGIMHHILTKGEELPNRKYSVGKSNYI